MGADRSHPAFRALHEALVRLSTRSHALSATVMDEGYAVWGEAVTLSLPSWDGPDASSGAGAKRYA